MESEASARWMGSVRMGKPGGGLAEMGMLKYVAQRVRSVLIHLFLSGVLDVVGMRVLEGATNS